MPLYDYKCEACHIVVEDVFVGLSDKEHPSCSECDAEMRRLVVPIPTVGPTWSKPIVSKQLRKTFDSQKKYDEYLRSKGLSEVAADDKVIADMKFESRTSAEATSRRMGYRDWEDRSQRRKAERLKAQQR